MGGKLMEGLEIKNRRFFRSFVTENGLTGAPFRCILSARSNLGQARRRRSDTLCIDEVKYDWDEGKDLLNRQKHGISFPVAALVFEDPNRLVYADRVDTASGEQRWHALGIAKLEPDTAAVLLVVHVYREEEYGEEIIRIISARAAEKHELRRYRAQKMD
jgi:uncharacterized DUF497 family protein